MELTILMPCLNEAETLATCIRKAKSFLEEHQVDGEVLISDNGSTDGSPDIAEAEGARVVHAPIRGYGGALIEGCKAARGTYVIMEELRQALYLPYKMVEIVNFLDSHSRSPLRTRFPGQHLVQVEKHIVTISLVISIFFLDKVIF